MPKFVQYRLSDGLITSVCRSDPGVDNSHLSDAAHALLDVGDVDVDDRASYVRLSNVSVQPRAALPAFTKTSVLANGTDAAVIANGLPNPTHVQIDGDGSDAFDVTDSALSLTFTTPGAYRVSLSAGVAYQESLTTITAS